MPYEAATSIIISPLRVPGGVVIGTAPPARLTLACDRPINKIRAGVGVGAGLDVPVGVGWGVNVDVGIGVGLGVDVGVCVGVGEGAGVGLRVGGAEEELRVMAKPIQLTRKATEAVSTGGVLPRPPSLLSPSNDAHCV